MNLESKAALFLMLGQSVQREVKRMDALVPEEDLRLTPSYDLAALLPGEVRNAVIASEAYKLLFVFENYLRDFILDVLAKDSAITDWWSKVPTDVQDEVAKLEATEEVKGWMALGSRGKAELLTLPQLLKIIDEKENWKQHFADIVRDKGLVHEARLITHLRNTICHMATIPDEEVNRIKQTMRDWFRVVAP